MPTTHFTVTGTSWVTPTLRRVHLRTDDLSAFSESLFSDRYVKLVFPKPGVEYPDQIDVRVLRSLLPPEDLPDVRTYTALHPDVAAGTMDIDFVVHGDEGIAGPWAASAEVGDPLIVNGPGGAYRPNPEADWYLFAGDESAIPAIGAALAVLPAGAVARVVLLVDSPAHQPALTAPANTEITWVYRSDPSTGTVESAVRSVEWLDGRVHAFIHGEAQETMLGIRPYLRTERALGRDQLSISGYWRRGRTEEGFREWKAQLAQTEGDEPRVARRPDAR